jgi:amidase
MPTTLGSILFKNYYPDRDSFVAEKLRKAGAIILAKATLGELPAQPVDATPHNQLI